METYNYIDIRETMCGMNEQKTRVPIYSLYANNIEAKSVNAKGGSSGDLDYLMFEHKYLISSCPEKSLTRPIFTLIGAAFKITGSMVSGTLSDLSPETWLAADDLIEGDGEKRLCYFAGHPDIKMEASITEDYNITVGPDFSTNKLIRYWLSVRVIAKTINHFSRFLHAKYTLIEERAEREKKIDKI